MTAILPGMDLGGDRCQEQRAAPLGPRRSVGNPPATLGASGQSSAAAGLFDLALDNAAPVALRDIGMKEVNLDRAAEIAMSNPYWNPRAFGVAQWAEIRELLQRAYEGLRPA